MKKLLSLLALVLPVLGFSQDEDLVYYDYVYADKIKSVKFHVDGLLTSMPATELASSSNLVLSFDELSGEAKNYVFSVQHCDANWQPSNLTEFEYIEGAKIHVRDAAREAFAGLAQEVHGRVVDGE